MEKFSQISLSFGAPIVRNLANYNKTDDNSKD